ncbi:hypothetical protein SKTS_09760 [Sulfurimicrobium lacus]|uniref:Uncharacterized protein n=1 Tax=Sulfurimicrobium lacus TaxID=2715678 RepID=A0A6F8V9T9_9PROT|nr:hypothetical protein SKTS_09760 [Sulfurimicrobium lacus]
MAIAVLDEVAVTIPEAFATVTFALPFTGIWSDVGDTESDETTFTLTLARLFSPLLMVTVAVPGDTPVILATPDA